MLGEEEVLTRDSAPENYNKATTYTSTKPKAVTSGGMTTCTIDQIVMEGPAVKARRGLDESEDEDENVDWDTINTLPDLGDLDQE